jgi:hypothetical protein
MINANEVEKKRIFKLADELNESIERVIAGYVAEKGRPSILTTFENVDKGFKAMKTPVSDAEILAATLIRYNKLWGNYNTNQKYN